jgi:hypothetical protein
MTSTERQPLPPITCAPWCTDGTGHPGTVFRSDQTCWGQSNYVELSLEDVLRDEYGVYTPRIGAQAYRPWGWAPCVACAVTMTRFV